MRGSRLQFSRSSHDRYGASGSRAAHKSRWRASGARRGVSCDRWFARQCRQWGLGIRATWRSVQPQAHLCLSSGRAEWWAQSCRVRLPIFLAHTWMMCMGCRIVANICFLVMCVKCLMRSLFGSSAAWSPSGVRGYNPGSERCCVGALPSCCLRPGPASHSPCPCGAQGLCSRPALGRWRFVWARSTCARQSPGKWRDATYGLTCNWATALSAYTSPACFVKRLSHRVGCHAFFPQVRCAGIRGPQTEERDTPRGIRHFCMEPSRWARCHCGRNLPCIALAAVGQWLPVCVGVVWHRRSFAASRIWPT